MSRALPIQVIRAMTERESGGQLVWLMRVTDNSTTPATIHRLVNDSEGLTGPDGEEYAPYPFEVVLPAQTGDQAPRLEAVVQDAALQITTSVLRNTDDLVADIYAVQRGVTQAETGSKSTWHDPIVSYEDFVIRRAVTNEAQVAFELTLDHFFDEPVGIWTMDADVAPWLY